MNRKQLAQLTVSSKLDLIEQNKYIKELSDDKDTYIRMLVARNGHKLEKLINDKESFVRIEVIAYCKKHKEKEECKNLLNLYNL